MRARGWRPPALVRDTGWTLLAQGGRLLSQALYFVIIARALGVDEFGALAATVALIAILTPFAALGAGNVLVMGVARERSAFPVLFGNALLSVLLTAWILVPLTVGVAALVLPGVPWEAVLLLSLAEYVLGRAADVGAMAFQAVDRLDLTALLGTIAPALRAVAAVLFVTLPLRHDIEVWSVLYVLASALGAVAAVSVVLRRLGRARMSPRLLRRHVRLGAYFAVSASATTIYGDIDKTMLGRLATFEATGIYAAADRAVGMAFVPVMALLTATYARFFRAGTQGMAGTTALARRLLPAAAGYGAFVGVALFLLAPLAPIVLGSDFQSSEDALRWLSPIPFLSALAYLAADALTGADAQGVRTIVQAAAAVVNVGLNLWLIPAYSWRGAAWATIASFAFLATALWIVSFRLVRDERRAGGPRPQSLVLDLPEPGA